MLNTQNEETNTVFYSYLAAEQLVSQGTQRRLLRKNNASMSLVFLSSNKIPDCVCIAEVLALSECVC